MNRTLVHLVAAVLSSAAAFAASGEQPRLELQTADAGQRVIVASGFEKQVLAALAQKAKEGSLAEVLTLHVGEEDAESQPAMLGEVRLRGDSLVFEPRFPLAPGVAYLAVLRLEGLTPGDASPRTIRKAFSLEKPDSAPAVVEHVFPSGEVVPENLLKFYIHFSRPMSRGEAYRRIRLLNDAGDKVEDPFLELGEELWDGTGTRFTLFFDPGRIKRGLKPREEVGPVLEEGKSYTLVVSADWPDADGQPLVREFRKSYQAAAPDDEQPDHTTWRLRTPAAGSQRPLMARFPEPLDHAMLVRVLSVVDSADNRIDGAITVDREETRWRFTPAEPWQAGEYRLVIDAALEDRAGNSIRKPFEVDVTRPFEENVRRDTVSLPFSVQ